MESTNSQVLGAWHLLLESIRVFDPRDPLAQETLNKNFYKFLTTCGTLRYPHPTRSEPSIIYYPPSAISPP